MFTKLIDHKRAEHAVLILAARQAKLPAHRAWFLTEAGEIRRSIMEIKRQAQIARRCRHCNWFVRWDGERWFMEGDVKCWHHGGHYPS